MVMFYHSTDQHIKVFALLQWLSNCRPIEVLYIKYIKIILGLLLFRFMSPALIKFFIIGSGRDPV